jgi:hypothetical protein
MTAAGVLLVLGVLAWYVGSVLLRAAAFGWFVSRRRVAAGRTGDQSPWAPVAFAGLGVVLGRRARAAPNAPRMVGHPDRRARVLRAPAAPPARAARAPSGATHGHARPR